MTGAKVSINACPCFDGALPSADRVDIFREQLVENWKAIKGIMLGVTHDHPSALHDIRKKLISQVERELGIAAK